MRRLATTVPAVVATVVAVITLSTGTALADDHGGGRATAAVAAHPQGSHQEGAHQEKGRHRGRGDRPRAAELVTLTGVVSDTATAAIGSGSAAGGGPTATQSATPTQSPAAVAAAPVASDTATSTITVRVKGGARELHGRTVGLTLDRNTVVRRGDSAATAADLRPGDHVSARVRRMPDGSWVVVRINASSPRRASEGNDD